MPKLIHILIFSLVILLGCQSQQNSIFQNDPLASKIYTVRTRIVIQKDPFGRYLDIGEIRKSLDQTESLFNALNIRFDIDKVEVWDYNQHVSIAGGRTAAAMYPEYVTIYFWQMYSDAGQVRVPFSSNIVFLAGVSSFPWESSKHGIFIFEGHSNPYTLAHEMGHYFGLHHTFNRGGDYVLDTEDTDDPHYCNVMNYHECDNNTFVTQGQIDRMRYYLIHYRKDIIK